MTASPRPARALENATASAPSFASWQRTAGMLAARPLLFLAYQGIMALVLAGQGQTDAFARSAAWWPVTATLASFSTLGLLRALLRSEHVSIRRFLCVDTSHIWTDLLTCLGAFAVSGPLMMLPNQVVARWLNGSEAAVGPLFFQPLPYAAALIGSITFALTVGLSELPTYFGYAMPRAEQLLASRWGAVLLSGLCLAAQHMALPFIPDWRFLAWRLLMFVPFALWIALCVRWRPRLLPYLMAGHFLIDLTNAPMLLAAATG